MEKVHFIILLLAILIFCTSEQVRTELTKLFGGKKLSAVRVNDLRKYNIDRVVVPGMVEVQPYTAPVLRYDYINGSRFRIIGAEDMHDIMEKEFVANNNYYNGERNIKLPYEKSSQLAPNEVF